MRRKDEPFQFRQFVVLHDRCAMKVGTDAVLLGAWVNVQKADRILEIGTGSGVISLLLAQRSAAHTQIDAVEMEEEDAKQAKENVARSPWPHKIHVHHTTIQNYKASFQYDLIVSNPPFFIRSLSPPSEKRKNARHAETLTYHELLDHSLRMLTPGGRFAVILPFREGMLFNSNARAKGLHCVRQLSFFPRMEKAQERWLFEFSLSGDEVRKETLILYGADNSWTEDYRKLTEAFYL